MDTLEDDPQQDGSVANMVSHMEQLSDAVQLTDQAHIAEDNDSLQAPTGAPQQQEQQDPHEDAAAAQAAVDAATSDGVSYLPSGQPVLFQAPPLNTTIPQPSEAEVEAQVAAMTAAASGSGVVYPSGAPMPDASGQWYVPMQLLWPAHANGTMNGVIGQQQLAELLAVQQHGHQGQQQAYAHLFGAGIPGLDYSQLAGAATVASVDHLQGADGVGGDAAAGQDNMEAAGDHAGGSRKRSAEDNDQSPDHPAKRQHQQHDHQHDHQQHEQQQLDLQQQHDQQMQQQLQELAAQAAAAAGSDQQHAAYGVMPSPAQQLDMGNMHMLPLPLDAPQQNHEHHQHQHVQQEQQQQQQQLHDQEQAGGMTPSQALAAAPAVVRAQRRGQHSEGIKVDDGRIYVPLPLIHQHFDGAEFPIKANATVVINDETVTASAEVNLRRTLNRTRTKGLGNHWLSGLQQVLASYAGLRLKRVDYNAADGSFFVHLTCQGRWTVAPKKSSEAGKGSGSSAGPAAAGAAAGAAEAADGAGRSGDAAAVASAQQAAAVGPQGAQQFSLEQLAAAGIDVAQLSMLTHTGDGATAADAPSAPTEAAEGDAAETPASGAETPSQAANASGGDGVDANGNTDEAAAMDLLLLAGQEGQGDKPSSSSSSGRKAKVVTSAHKVLAKHTAEALLAHGNHPQDFARSTAALAAAATAARLAVAAGGDPVEIAAAEAAEAEAMRTASMAAAFAALDAAQTASGVQAPADTSSTSAIASALQELMRMNGTAQQHTRVAPDAANADPQQQQQQQQQEEQQQRPKTPPPGGGPGGVNPEGGLRIYYGRIYAPLKLVQTHFPNATFPVACKADVWVNDQQHADPLNVRVVAYKKHRRPDQFNYWITGLQKVLQHQTDVRVTGVEWSNERDMFLIHLTVPPQTEVAPVVDEGARLGYYAQQQQLLQQQARQELAVAEGGVGLVQEQEQQGEQEQQQHQQEQHAEGGTQQDAQQQQEQQQQQQQQQMQLDGSMVAGTSLQGMDAASAAFVLQPYGMGGMLQGTRPEQADAAAASMQQLQHLQQLHNLPPGALVQYGAGGAGQAFGYQAAATGADGGAGAAGMYLSGLNGPLQLMQQHHASGAGLQLLQQPGGGLQLVQGSAVGYPQYSMANYGQFMGPNGLQLQFNPLMMGGMGVSVAGGEGGEVDMAGVMEAHAQQQAAVAEQHHQQQLQQLAHLQQLHQQQQLEEQEQQAAHAVQQQHEQQQGHEQHQHQQHLHAQHQEQQHGNADQPGGDGL